MVTFPFQLPGRAPNALTFEHLFAGYRFPRTPATERLPCSAKHLESTLPRLWRNW